VYFGIIGGSTFAGLISDWYGWRWSFLVFGGLGIVLGVILHRFLHETPRGAADHEEGGAPLPRLSLPAALRLAWQTPTILALLLGFMCANYVAMVVYSWMPSFLKEKFQLNLAMAGFTATFYVQMASMIGALLGGWLADYFRRVTPAGRILTQAIGVLVGAPFIYWCGQTSSIVQMIVALTALGLCKGIYDANIFA
jgi:sugar phosphate permease